ILLFVVGFWRAGGDFAPSGAHLTKTAGRGFPLPAGPRFAPPPAQAGAGCEKNSHWPGVGENFALHYRCRATGLLHVLVQRDFSVFLRCAEGLFVGPFGPAAKIPYSSGASAGRG